MKSVIINLKYLIFRSAFASEGGSLEEQAAGGGGVEEKGKSRAAASVLSASATLKPAPTQAQTVFQIFLGGGGWRGCSSRSPSLRYLFNTRYTYTVSFLRLQIGL